MTAVLTEATAKANRPAKPRARGLVWVVWRQHRAALIGITAVLVLSALTLLWYGLKMHSDFTQLGLADCGLGRRTRSCTDRLDAFSSDQNLVTILTTVFVPLPVLLGLFIGAPLLAREYESGTYRFAFTQGVGRTRWLVSKIVLLAVFTVAVTGAMTLVIMWWYRPLVGLNGRLAGSIYEIYGVVFVGRALFGLALGILVGALIRRVVPAIALTLAGWTAVVVSSIALLRAHLLTPLKVVNAAIPGRHPWIVGETWTSPGGHILNGVETNDLMYTSAMAGHKLDIVSYLATQGYHYTAYYQPASRYWALQSIEAGGLIVLALVFTVAAVRLVRRRTA